MYICGDTNTVAQMEPETAGYVPNNPLFGLPLESPQECPTECGGCQNCQGTTSLSLSGLHGSDFDCGNCLDHNNILSLSQGNTQSTNINNGYWSEDMNSFPGLPPLELDPLPSLFPFSPCGASYNRTERMQPNHEGHVADVLLSLKHAVLKPNSDTPQMPNHQQPSNYPSDGYSKITPQASVSYIASVHPQMHLLSPSNYNTMTSQAQNPYPSTSYYDTCVQHPPPSMYPSSLSVNVSMTMHGCGGAVDTPMLPMQCSHSQMQWNPQNSGSSVNVQNVLYPPLLSPGAYSGGATYSFTADFRPQSSTQNNVPLIEPMKFSPTSHQKQFFQISSKHFNQSPVDPNVTYTSPQKSPNYGQVKIKDAKSLGINYENDDDSSDDLGGDNKPNLCRLCGKTYARPSTLKTHLRTHSGERPYRCNSCNKSFSQAANLTAHLRTHTGQKPFRCQICDRRFSQSSSVTTHMRTHSGERPYRCRACKKAFSDSSTLTKHLRIHSGEKPYQCKICSLRFSQSGNLNRHMRVHGTNGALIT